MKLYYIDLSFIDEYKPRIFSDYGRAKKWLLKVYHIWYEEFNALWANPEEVEKTFDDIKGIEDFGYIGEVMLDDSSMPDF